MTDTEVSMKVLGSAWPGHFNKTIAETMYANIEKAGLPPRALGHQDWPPADASVTEVVERLEQVGRLDEAGDLGLLLAKAARPTRADRNRLVRALRGAGPSVGGRVLVATGPSTLRDTMLTQLYAWAGGDPDHAPDPRSTAVLFVFAT